MSRTKAHILRSLPVPCLACCLALAGPLIGCGGGSSDSLVHFQGSSESISKATLNHWMHAKAGADFRAIIGTKGPQGLVAEPANYAECSEAVKKVVPRSFTGQLKLSDVQIKRKCEELYGAVKGQALLSLIQAHWAAVDAAKAGVHVSPASLHKAYERYRAGFLPSEADLHKYLTERNLSVSDLVFEVKQGLFKRTLKPKYLAEAKQRGGEILLARYREHVAKTSCAKGYVVAGCKGYREPAGGAPAPNVILEGFAQGQGSSK